MAILKAKTPEGLFKQIEPERYSPHGMDKMAQTRANQTGKVYGTTARFRNNPKGRYFIADNNDVFDDPNQTIQNAKGRRIDIDDGVIKLPDQWKYKRGDKLASTMTRNNENPLFKEYDLVRQDVENDLRQEYDLARTPKKEIVDYLRNKYNISYLPDARELAEDILKKINL